MREARYASAFSFKYSRRPGTPGAAMPRQVAEAEKSERLQRLQALLGEQQAAFNAACVGRTLPVLFEKPGRHAGQLVGRSPYLQAVHADGAGRGCSAGSCRSRSRPAQPNSLSGALTRRAGSGARLSPEAREFIPLSDAGLRAVSGPNSRHAALIEDAFHVLVETPGGGVSLAGDAKARAAAKRAVRTIAERADRGAEVSEADVRAAAAAARGGAAPVGGSVVAARPARRDPAEDGRAGALSRPDATARPGLRRRAGGDGQDLPRRGARRRRCCSAGRSTGWSSPARRSRRASGWASCPAT